MKWLFIAVVLCNTLFAQYVAKDYSHLLGMPGFSKELLRMHFVLYQGYVQNTNALLAKLKSMGEKGQENSYEWGALKRRLGWEFDGMRLHEFYFGNLGGDGVAAEKSHLYRAICSQFGSFNQWKANFIATGAMRGIGWAVLYLDPQQNRLINTWINEHDVGHLAGGTPILVMDVFEHAYMPQFGLDRKKYIEVFFKNLDWDVIDRRYLCSPFRSAGEQKQ